MHASMQKTLIRFLIRYFGFHKPQRLQEGKIHAWVCVRMYVGMYEILYLDRCMYICLYVCMYARNYLPSRMYVCTYMVTARGRPSGMATTIIVTPIIKASTTPSTIAFLSGLAFFAQIIPTRATKVKIDTLVPIFL